MIRDAIEEGAKQICLTLGGSATNDGGAGIAAALGMRLLDEAGREIEPTCAGLEHLKQIDDREMRSLLKQCSFMIACDVKNPLCGLNGASAVYGPQKGADTAMVWKMDEILQHYGKILEEMCIRDSPWSEDCLFATGVTTESGTYHFAAIVGRNRGRRMAGEGI